MMFFSSKYSAAALLLLLTLASLQQLVFAQTSAPFVNTPGVQVQAPANGLSVRPDGLIPIALNIGRRAISSVVVTMAKADGSGNTTILDYNATAALRITMTTPLASFKLPEGDYILNLVITPNMTVVIPGYTPPSSSSSSSSSSGTLQQPVPTTVPPSSLPEIYYWRTNIHISNDAPANGNASGSGGGASNNAVIACVTGMTGAWTTFANMMTSLTVLAFVNVVVL